VKEGLTRIKGRLRIAAVIAVCMAIVAVPALAQAETWMSESPLGTIHAQPAAVTVDVFGATVNATTGSIKIDGNAVKTTGPRLRRSSAACTRPRGRSSPTPVEPPRPPCRATRPPWPPVFTP
jgi:hypothetical protein